jgi:hypothetical protein
VQKQKKPPQPVKAGAAFASPMNAQRYFDGAVNVVPSYVQPTAGIGLIVSMRMAPGYCAPIVAGKPVTT